MQGKVKINKLTIGLYLYSVTGTELYIHNLELKPEMRGKGHFKLLWASIKTTAISEGCTSIRLEPAQQQIPGHCPSTEWLQGLYSRYGFQTRDGRYYSYELGAHPC